MFWRSPEHFNGWTCPAKMNGINIKANMFIKQILIKEV